VDGVEGFELLNMTLIIPLQSTPNIDKQVYRSKSYTFLTFAIICNFHRF